MNINLRILEAALASIFIFTLLLIFKVTNQSILTLVAFLLLIFILLSAKSFLKTIEVDGKLRIYCLVAIGITLHGYLLVSAVGARQNDPKYSVHDGTIITEESYRQFLAGNNPYSISYGNLYRNQVDYLDKVAHDELDRNNYSPLALLINFPVFAITDAVFGIIDMRIFLVMSFFLAAFLSLYIVGERVLFLIIFLFNPVFAKSIYFGANDVLILLMLSVSVFFLYFRKIELATVAVALGSATKLLFLPFIPLYFLYINQSKKDERKLSIFKNLAIFTVICVAIYLPFIVWNTKDFFDDFIIYNFFGGNLGRPIAGFLGFPQIINKFGLIAQNNSFPFFIFLIPLSMIFLLYSEFIFRKFATLPLLVFLYAVLFILIFSFSRIVQSDYLTFLSQVLVLSAFLKGRR